MKPVLTKSLLMLTFAAVLSGCAGMTQKQKNAAVGAAIGGVAGSVLTDGSKRGTDSRATLGGAIGHGVK